jgi:alkylation response protein AidB-like acyl-CoA dehydrogenase
MASVGTTIGSLDATTKAALSEEQIALRQAVRSFMDTRIEPIIAECEKEGRLPVEVLTDLAQFGYLGGILAEERGGMGLTYTDLAVIMEEAGYHWMSLRSTLSVINMVALMLDRAASDIQRKTYLEPLLRGERLCWFGLTEPEHGSDVRVLNTVAVEDSSGDFRISGTKLWITNGAIGDFGIVLANVKHLDGSEGGLTAFLIDPSLCTFEGHRIETMFIKATTTSELVFDETIVSADMMVGEVGMGHSLFMKGLDLGRLNVAMGAIGAGQRALDMSIRYAREREQFGKRIGEFQLVQELIADMRMQSCAARALGYATARMLDAGGVNQTDCAVAKLFATETAFSIADKALQVHGGMGLSMEYGLERIFRDTRGGRTVEGTPQIQRLVIARDQLGISAFN